MWEHLTPNKTVFCRLLGGFVFFFKRLLTTEYSAFRKLWPFSANKKTGLDSKLAVLEKPEQELKSEI